MKKCISFFTAMALSLVTVSQVFVVSAEETAASITTAAELQTAVTNGGTYKVADGIEQLDCSELQLQIRKDIELDLNNAVILVDNDGFNMQNYEMTVTIENGTISGSGNYAVKAMAKTPSVINLNNITTTGAKNGIASANSYYTININGGNIGGTSTGIAATMGYYNIDGANTGGITLSNASTLDAKNTTITAVGNGITAYNTALGTLTDCEITGGVNNYGIFWKSSNTLVLDGTDVEMNANGKGVLHTDSTTASITITDSTLNNTCETVNKAYIISSNSTDASNITINSGTFNGVFAMNAASSTVLAVNGGLFSSDPSAYLADGLGVAQDSAGMYEVMDASLVPTAAPATEAPTETPTDEPTQTETPTTAPTPTPNPALALDNIYSSDMIFQRSKPILISGTGTSGNKVTVTFNGESAEDIIEYGIWEVTLPAMDVVKSADMKIVSSDGNEITLTNIAVGDVIVMSGQSNMFRDFNAFRTLQSELDKDYPDIRLLRADKLTENEGWMTATTANAINFSTMGFMTGKRLYNQTDGEVPIGLIRAAYDGSNIVSWVNNSAYAFDPDLSTMYNSSNTKSKWHTAYIKPIQKLNVGGVMWYQGEGNTWYKNNNYEKAMTMLIDSWRNEWKDESLPFVVVQLPTADFEVIYGNRTASNTGGFSTGIGVRDGQWQVSQKMDNVNTVVTIDTGRKTEVHPQDKQVIADRAANAFEHYLMDNNDIVYLSPSYERMEIKDGKAVIYFKNVSDKLISKDDTEIKGFTAAGSDGVFNPVSAEISDDGQTVIVDTTGIENPQVRYAWGDTPSLDESNTQYYSNINLVNESGFAVAPFRTDSGKYMYMLDDAGEKVEMNYSPWVRKITVSDGASDSEKLITVKADDTDGTVTSVEVFIDDVSAGQAVNVGNVWTYTASGLTEGVHTVYAVVTDNDNALSTTQDGSMGTTTNIPYPAHEAFIIGEGAERIDVYMSDTESLSEYVSTYGDTSAVTSGKPGGYYKDVIKLSAGTAKDAAAITVPVGSEATSSIVTFETNIYIESSGAGSDSSTAFEMIMGDGSSRPLFAFTATSLRICGNYYEILKGAKECDKWYNLKLELDIHRGTFSAWVDGVQQYSNQSWIYLTKDFDKQLTWFESLKTGITSLKVIHTQSGADVTTASYIDGTALSVTSYGDTSAPEPTPTPDVTPTQKPTEEPTPTPGEDEEPSAEVKYEDGKITAVFTNLNTDGIVFAAEYENGVLANIKSVPLSEIVNIDYIKKTDEIKVYIWDLEQKPLFDVITLQ